MVRLVEKEMGEEVLQDFVNQMDFDGSDDEASFGRFSVSFWNSGRLTSTSGILLLICNIQCDNSNLNHKNEKFQCCVAMVAGKGCVPLYILCPNIVHLFEPHHFNQFVSFVTNRGTMYHKPSNLFLLSVDNI